MISLYDTAFWLNVFHIFTVALIVYSILHKIWEYSRTTLIIIVGFEILGLLLQFAPIGTTIIFLIVLMLYLYLRAILKPRHTWSKYETKNA